MNPHLKTLGSEVITHLKDALLYIMVIASVEDVLPELRTVYVLCFRFIGKHQ